MSSLVFPTLPGLDIVVEIDPYDGVQTDETQNGKEVRSTWETYERTRYKLKFNFLRDGTLAEWQQLVGFRKRHGGSFDSFLFTDPQDKSVATHPFGVGDGATLSFQLQRTLVPSTFLASAGARSYWPTLGDGYEPITSLSGTVQVFLDTGSGPVLKTLGTDYTLPGFGAVLWASAPAVGSIMTWTGNYYRRCRFADSSLPTPRIVFGLWSAPTVNLVSVKEEEVPLQQVIVVPPATHPLLAISTGTAAGTSTNGSAWTSQTLLAGSSSANGCHNGTTYCVVIGTTVIYRSLDGHTWNSTTVAGHNWLAVAANPATGAMVAVDANGITVHSTDNGVTWTAGGTGIGTAGGLPFLVYAGTFWCMINQSASTSAISTDNGATWTAGSGPGAHTWHGLAWNGTTLCTVGALTRNTSTSTDGLTWSANATVMPAITGNVWLGIAANPATGTFVATAGQTSASIGNVATSTDGVSWSLRTVGATANWNAPCWSATLGLFLIVAQDNGNPSFAASTLFATSPTGATWTVQTAPSSQSWVATIP